LAKKKHSVGVIIAAGGAGRRLGGRIPKQFLPLGGIPILQRTVAIFARIPEIEEIVVVCPTHAMHRVGKILRSLKSEKLLGIVEGGKERQDSVWNGLHAFVGRPEIVLVHDAVRPLIEEPTIRSVIAAATAFGAAVVGVRVNDTLKEEGKKGFSTRTVDRRILWGVQTPQGFSYDLLMTAHKRARRTRFLGTDEAALVERMNVPVRIVPGDPRNLKITTRADLQLAEFYLKKDIRVRR
jgi:2-C-methyl-D-erythritol 4-phosphate cytidylyltransferase